MGGAGQPTYIQYSKTFFMTKKKKKRNKNEKKERERGRDKLQYFT